MGDVLFALANLARFMNLDPEESLRKANDRFRRRFMAVESKVRDSGREMKLCSLEELDVFWEEAKKQQFPSPLQGEGQGEG